MRTESDIESFINDLDSDEITVLVKLVDGLDPLFMQGGEPFYSADEINLIQRFQQFVVDHPVDGDESETDDDNIEVDPNEDDETEAGETTEADQDAVSATADAADLPNVNESSFTKNDQPSQGYAV